MALEDRFTIAHHDFNSIQPDPAVFNRQGPGLANRPFLWDVDHGRNVVHPQSYSSGRFQISRSIAGSGQDNIGSIR